MPAEDVRVASINDRHGRATVELSAGSSEFNLLRISIYPSKARLDRASSQGLLFWAGTYVVASEVMYVGLPKHRNILEL